MPVVPILVRTVRAFWNEDYITRIVVVVPPALVEHTRISFLPATDLAAKALTIVAGGLRRQDSVKAGLDTLDDTTEIVLVHDGARPLVSRQFIDSML